MSTLWLSPEASGVLCWPDTEPRHNYPIGTRKLQTVPIRSPVLLLYEHWDGTSEPPSPGSHEDLSYHADSNQLGEITVVSASQLLRYFVAAPMPHNRKLTAATYLNQMYHWVPALASLALGWTHDGNLPWPEKSQWISILPKEQLINDFCEALRICLLLLKQICPTFKSCKMNPLSIFTTTNPKKCPYQQS